MQISINLLDLFLTVSWSILAICCFWQAYTKKEFKPPGPVELGLIYLCLALHNLSDLIAAM